jgi:glycosyltransferase involved in cell wall biosynthesis
MRITASFKKRNMTHDLQPVLVVTFAKSFWASPAARRFPRTLVGRRYVKKMSSYVNAVPLAVRTFITTWRTRPHLLFVGAAPQISPWFLSLKKYRLLPPETKIGCQNYNIFNDHRIQYADLIVDYAKATVAKRPESVRPRNKILPLPADGNFAAARQRPLPDQLKSIGQPFIFSGGGEGRDFPTLIEALSTLPLQVVIVTFSPRTLGYYKTLPPNCHVFWQMPYPDFLAVMARAQFVVLPLQPGNQPHGQMTLVQAARLGKAVIATRGASVDDYLEAQSALTVPPHDPAALRSAILDLHQHPDKLQTLERAAERAASRYTYENYARELSRVFAECLAAPQPV